MFSHPQWLPGSRRCSWGALTPLAVGVKIVCDLSKLCNYSAYARLSKLNTHKLTAATAAAGESALPCFGFTVRRLIDFYLCCACVCSCSISTTWRMRNMATCPTTHTRTLRLGMGPSMGLQTFLINFQAAKKQRQLGMPTEKGRGKMTRRGDRCTDSRQYE